MAKADGTKQPGVGQPALYEIFESRRKYPRIVVNAPIRLTVNNDTTVSAVVHDVSIDGIQIRCDRDTAKWLHPSGKFIAEGKGQMVEVQFDLPIRGQPATVNILSQVYYLSVISEMDIAFGLMFRNHLGNSAALVDRFIMDQILPVEEKVRDYLEQPRSHQEISEHMNMQGNEVAEVLDRLQVKGEIITYEENRQIKHLKLSTAIANIFTTIDDIVTRLDRLEQAISKR